MRLRRNVNICTWWQCIYDDVPTPLSGDPLRIHQVLSNLVGNALKFTHEGDVIVRVMLDTQEGQHVVLRIGVSDTGIGLSEEHQNSFLALFPGKTQPFTPIWR